MDSAEGLNGFGKTSNLSKISKTGKISDISKMIDYRIAALVQWTALILYFKGFLLLVCERP